MAESTSNAPLKDLYCRLSDPANALYIRYSQNAKTVSSEEAALELLEVGRSYPPEKREHVSLARFSGKIDISYTGEDARSMAETMERLRLPTAASLNLGEKVFQLFRDNIEGREGPLYLSQSVTLGKEEQFDGILRKLIKVYQEDEKREKAKNNNSDTKLQ